MPKVSSIKRDEGLSANTLFQSEEWAGAASPGHSATLILAAAKASAVIFALLPLP